MDVQARDPDSQGETDSCRVEGGRRMITIQIEDIEDVIELFAILGYLAEEGE
jgi:hypothetical protein